VQIEIGGFRIVGISDCYADVEQSEVLAHVGSAGRIEIAIRDGNAAEELQATCGRSVIVRWKERSE
jgi:S-adenosylmethionine hydrolase